MWVWRTKSILEDPKERKIFFDFCKSPHCDSTKSIKLLFFSVKKGDFLDQKTLCNLRNFLDEAHSQGIGVFYCVGGDPDWAKRENHGKALERISLALEFNTQSQSPKERFEGILFDVEPFLLEDWKNDPKTVADQWVELVGKCKDLIESSGQKFIFGWVIPYWLDKEKYEFLNKKLQDLTDFVAVMDYWDTAKRIIEKGRGEIDYGEEINKKGNNTTLLSKSTL